MTFVSMNVLSRKADSNAKQGDKQTPNHEWERAKLPACSIVKPLEMCSTSRACFEPIFLVEPECFSDELFSLCLHKTFLSVELKV